jgi:hypothetical protein
MKNKKSEYTRDLSADEVKQHRIMVTKEALGFFPKPFKKFKLQSGSGEQETAVEAVECHCLGSAQPHEHYWLPVKPEGPGHTWERGRRVTIRKVDGGYAFEML